MAYLNYLIFTTVQSKHESTELILFNVEIQVNIILVKINYPFKTVFFSLLHSCTKVIKMKSCSK